MYQINKLKHLSHDEINDLLKTIKHDSSRNGTMIQFALETGARCQEVLNVTKRDIDLTNRTVFIKGIKGSNDRELPIGGDLLAKLKKHIAKLDDEHLVFPIRARTFRDVWQNYRPCLKKLHSLRHTFAIQLYEKHRDIRLVQIALGHRNINNTMVYAQYVHSRSELKNKIVGLFT